MKKLKIFISHNENSLGAACKIKNELLNPCEIIYIEDFVRYNKYKKINENDIIYFSCNSKLIYDVMEKIKNVNCYIFNKSFFLNRYSKLELQLCLKRFGISIPKIYRNIDELKFPVFCKENSHQRIIFQTFNLITLKKFFTKFNINDFYFEESLFENNNYILENKYYYANGKINAENGKIITKEINVLI